MFFKEQCVRPFVYPNVGVEFIVEAATSHNFSDLQARAIKS